MACPFCIGSFWWHLGGVEKRLGSERNSFPHDANASKVEAVLLWKINNLQAARFDPKTKIPGQHFEKSGRSRAPEDWSPSEIFRPPAAKSKCLAQSNKSQGTGHRDKGAALAMVPSQIIADLIMDESIDHLRSHFGLTPAEARLALHLVTGETLRSAAAKLTISYETARSHLKNIFKKTATCRQTQLVVVILTVLPGCLNAALPP